MYLEKILETKKREVAEAKERLPMNTLVKMAENLPPTRSMVRCLSSQRGAIIAEIKRRSPSRGALADGIDPGQLARLYERCGAKAISVLTDFTYFGGSAEDLSAARAVVKVPVLRKDFIVDPYQIYESRLMGADCVLLIADILNEEDLTGFMARAAYLGMDCLVEVHDREALTRAINSGAAIIGINNRDLRTFKVDINTTLKLREFIPSGVTVVSESGIKSRKEIEALTEAGINAFLIGEAIMTAPDREAALRNLIGDEAKNGSC